MTPHHTHEEKRARIEAGRRLHAEFEDTLDTLHPVEIGRATYLASRVLASVDPIAYAESAGAFFDGVERDGDQYSAEAWGEFFRLVAWHCLFFGRYDVEKGAHI